MSTTGWAHYVESERAKDEKKREANPGPELHPQEVVVPGHEVPLDKAIKKTTTVGKVAWYAWEHHWTVKVGSAVYRKADYLRNGEVVEGKEITWYWTQGISPDGLHHFSASTDLLLYDGWPVANVEELKVGISEHGEED